MEIYTLCSIIFSVILEAGAFGTFAHPMAPETSTDGNFYFQKKLQEVIEHEEAAGRVVSRDVPREDRKAARQFQERMDIDDQDIIIQGNNTTRLSRKQVSKVLDCMFLNAS